MKDNVLAQATGYISVVENGKPGIDGNDGKDGVGMVPSYCYFETKPDTKPQIDTLSNYKANDALGNGWRKSIENKARINNISYNNAASGGSWIEVQRDGCKWYQSPSIGDRETTTMRIEFYTTEENQSVSFFIRSYSESGYDFVMLSYLDADGVSTDNCKDKASGNNNERLVSFSVDSIGKHHVYVGYSKDVSNSVGDDCGLVRIDGIGSIYQCNGYVDEYGNITWGEQFKVEGTDGNPGQQGTSIVDVKTQYVLSSKKEADESLINSAYWQDGWLSATKDHPYLWSRTVTTLSNNTVIISQPALIGTFTERGINGRNGCLVRQSHPWKKGVVYHNDNDLITDDIKYLDVVIIEDDTTDEGWSLYQCNITHTATGDSFNPNAVDSNGVSLWVKLINAAPTYFPLVMAKNAVLRFTQTQRLSIEGASAHIEMENGIINIFGSIARNIEFGVNGDGYAVLRYYDNDGNILYDLGPNGFDAAKIYSANVEAINVVSMSTVAGKDAYSQSKAFSDDKIYVCSADSSVESTLFVKHSNNSAAGYKPAAQYDYYPYVKTLYRYTAARINGTIVKDDERGFTAEQAKEADGKYYTTIGKNTKTLADGVFVRVQEAVRLNVSTAYGGCPKYALGIINIKNGVKSIREQAIYSIEERPIVSN